MSLSESSCASSSKRQENGDISTGTERPLKKARFAWQVKGKYHLRNETNENIRTNATQSEPEKAGPSTEIDKSSHDLAGSTEQNLEILGDYLLKQDFNTLDSVINNSEKSTAKPCREVVTESLEYPRYVASYDNNGINVPNKSSCSSSSSDSYGSTPVPVSMVEHSSKVTEEQCIARWQARQMAKGFVDNTINRVLDSWMIAPIPTEMDNNRFLALDVADFINNLPGANSIENEGILMAISAHGLQNTLSSTSKDNNTRGIEVNHNITTNNCLLSHLPSSPSSSEDDITEIPQKLQVDKNWDLIESTCSSNTEPAQNSSKSQPHGPLTPPPYISETSSQTSSILQEDSRTDNFYSYYDGDENASGHNDIFADHYDFMDAAVSFAIQNKGLTSYGTDYG